MNHNPDNDNSSDTSTSNNGWIQALWNWADACNMPAEELPRTQDALLNVEKRNLWNSYLTHLQPEIKQLRKLREFWLESNPFTDVSPEIKAFLRSARCVYGWKESGCKQ